LPPDGAGRKIVVARADIMTIGREDGLAAGSPPYLGGQ